MADTAVGAIVRYTGNDSKDRRAVILATPDTDLEALGSNIDAPEFGTVHLAVLGTTTGDFHVRRNVRMGVGPATFGLDPL